MEPRIYPETHPLEFTNRPIKFRGWCHSSDTDEYEMLYDIQDCCDGPPNHYDGFGLIVTDGRHKVMQYTGLKDLNGQEIYEGDIIRNAMASDPEDKGFIVIWQYYEFMARLNNLLNGKVYDVPFNEYFRKTEVIGNIYESPFLVENFFWGTKY